MSNVKEVSPHFLNKKTNKQLKVSNKRNKVKIEEKSFSVNISELKHKNLKYEIDSWSSYISNFHPNNILYEGNQLSKWSVDSKSKNEFLFLKLEKTSIVYIVTFAKFRDPTNLKEFKIFAGMDKTNMIEILHSVLSYDNDYESFTVCYKWNDTLIPSNYLKLVPIRPYYDSYNISVWFMNIKGIDDEATLTKIVKIYNDQTQIESMKMWLKLSRQNFKNKSCQFMKIKGINNMIQKLEDPLLTQLYENLMKGNYTRVIKIIENCLELGFYDYYVHSIPYKIKWKKLNLLDNLIDDCFDNISHSISLSKKTKRISLFETENNILNNINETIELNNINNSQDEIIEFDSPSSGYTFLEDLNSPNIQTFLNEDENKNIANYPLRRGGHSMAIDDDNQIIYLFGGWSGYRELNDLWAYDINTNTWKLICNDDNGPSPRSCIKMIYDKNFNRLMVYGKFSPCSDIQNENVIHEYDLNKNIWKKLTYDVQKISDVLVSASQAGPGQVYEHQMVFDQINGNIYIFGGIKIPENEDRYLGLWKLDLNLGYWENLELEKDHLNIKLTKRSGHSMVFDQFRGELIILGGNRKKNSSNQYYPIISYQDMMSLNVNNLSLKEIFHDYSKNQGPDVNFSSCTVFDSNKREIYLFGGGYKTDKIEFLTNHLWCYNFYTGKWVRTIRDEFVNYEKIIFSKNQYINDKSLLIDTENNDSLNFPCPRFAHCMLYSNKSSKGYIFGGNPNLKTTWANRLDDFWSFELYKKSTTDIKDYLLLKIYKFYYKELCYKEDFKTAMIILNEKITPLLKGNDAKRRKLINNLLTTNIDYDKYKKRYEIYEKIIKYFSKPFINEDILNR